MNDINEMPPKCQYCPYWEVCEYPWVCPDREQLATNLQQTCYATDTISRQDAIDAVSDCGICIQRIVDLPSAQSGIIRCKDCLMHGVCRFEQGLGLDGYCSQAERRTDE